MNFRPGDVLLSTYRVEQPLGRGGAGEVVCAEHLRLGQRVAIKALREERSQEARPRARMDREARAAARLRGEHAVRIFDLHELPDGRPLVIMELVRGPSLADLLSERGALPLDEAVDYVLQTCEGLAEAHALGIIHRDIKPSNLLLTRRPDGSPLIKIVDFGLATLPSLERITQSEAMLGSPPYMSPEQIRSPREVDERTDVWSLGVVLYELCTGALPWSGYTSAGVLASITADDPLPAAGRGPALPGDIDALFARLLQKDRELRPASVAEAARLLAPLHPEGAARADRISTIRASLSLASYEPPAPPAPRSSGTATEEPDTALAPPSTSLTTSLPGAPASPATDRPAPPPAPSRLPWLVAAAASIIGAASLAWSARATAPTPPRPEPTASPAASLEAPPIAAPTAPSATAATTAIDLTAASATPASSPLAASATQAAPPSAQGRREPPRPAASARAQGANGDALDALGPRK